MPLHKATIMSLERHNYMRMGLDWESSSMARPLSDAFRLHRLTAVIKGVHVRIWPFLQVADAVGVTQREYVLRQCECE